MSDKKITKKKSICIIAVSITVLIICILFSFSLAFGFLADIIITIIILCKSGIKIKELIDICKTSVLEARMLYIIIILIGATTSIWLCSGAVPTIMYYGFYYMQNMNFLLCSFLIVTLVSIFVGTAVGTVSTVGLAILGIGRGFNIPDGILVGVIVSGAFIADKFSPISGLYNLTLDTVERSYKDVAGTIMRTLLPTVIITAIIYYFIGRGYFGVDISQIEIYRNELAGSFDVTPIVLFLPLAVLILSFLGLKLTRTIALGLLIGVIFSIVIQGHDMLQIAKWVIFGFKGATASEKLNNILASGGIVSMLEVLIIVGSAVALVGLFEKNNIITPFIDSYIKGAKTKGSLIIRTGIISSILTVVTCDQTVGIILPGRLLKKKYDDMNIDRAILVRTISDTGTIIAPLMIWNVNAILIEPITQVSALSYAPFAVLCYITPLITLIFAKIEK